MPRFLWLLPVFFILYTPDNLHAQRRNAIQTVVIDAGHGGHDPGAIGQVAREKNINLAIALKLGNLIKHSMKDVRVIYTRDKDYFVELYRRAEIANENKADLFICIHCNANPNHSMKGAETYVMGLHKSQANLNIAKLENASILLESDYQSTYNGFDPNADESYIIFSLFQNSNLGQSTDLAAGIQTQLVKHQAGALRGVRQAGFIVLYKTTMPSVLVETGYISNPEEEKLLMSGAGQDNIAASIFRAFKTFRDGMSSQGTPDSKPGMEDSMPQQPKTSISGEARDTNPVIKVPVKPGKPSGESSAVQRLSYAVQIKASVDKLDDNDPRLVKFSKVRMYRHDGFYKYAVGDETTLDGAEKLLDDVRRKGVKDAFIVIFRNGSRIPQEEASRLLGK
jgi:N-acetylmuramoyl-L-alanine amidase